ncbi:hypothetical protein BGC07_13660 [Piscirickettsia litoralis]|uniref:Uncharacterized protein n=1 Tax=Piscirickettsia litoralis TaxID=1891921 RepID=A0ABX3A4G3_9GAMM|nr:hypothetical protein BGC07_13660 [Piscirickettsia litoralis]
MGNFIKNWQYDKEIYIFVDQSYHSISHHELNFHLINIKVDNFNNSSILEAYHYLKKVQF